MRLFDVTEPEMPDVGRRSRELVETEFEQITWEHSHVVVDDDGSVRTYCVYEAPTADMVRRALGSGLGRHEIASIEEIVGDVTPADFPPV